MFRGQNTDTPSTPQSIGIKVFGNAGLPQSVFAVIITQAAAPPFVFLGFGMPFGFPWGRREPSVESAAFSLSCHAALKCSRVELSALLVSCWLCSAFVERCRW